MKFVIILLFILVASPLEAKQINYGTVTSQGTYEQGGFFVEIDRIRFLFMKEAKIIVDSKPHNKPERIRFLTAGTKVRYRSEGVRIYELEILWRN